MQTFSFSLTNARLAYLLTITRNDETVIRVTNASKPITISSVTWTPAAKITIGDVTNTNDGTLPTYSFDISAPNGSLFPPLDIDNGLFEDAAILLESRTRPTRFRRIFSSPGASLAISTMIRRVMFTFEVLSSMRFLGTSSSASMASLRCRLWRSETLQDTDISDLEIGSKDLHDVARLETIVVGDRRRFRFSGTGHPDDYANVYLLATVTGSRQDQLQRHPAQ